MRYRSAATTRGVGRTIPDSTSEADMARHVSRTSSRIGAINVLLMLVVFAVYASPAYASTPFAWSPPQPIAAPGIVDLTHVACAPSSTLCVASDYFDGDIAASTDATGDAGGWLTANVDGRAVESLGASLADINGIACPSTTLCVAVDDSGHILSATHPAESAAAWKRLLPAATEGHALTSITCPSTTLCVVADNDGTVLTSTDPSGGSEAWTATRLAAIPETVGCETPTLCVAVSITGQIMTSSNPAGGESAWTSPTESVDGSHPPLVMSCAVGLCAFTDGNGDVASATNPTGGASEWTSANVLPGEYISSISCPSSSLCLIALGNGHGAIYYSTTPHGGAGEWTKYNPPSGETTNISSVACASTTLCVGGLFTGIITTTTPTIETTTWTKTELKSPGGLSHISCASSSLCVAIESGTGNVLTSTTPSVEGSEWKTTTISTGPSTLNGISCVVGSTLCVADDGDGNVFTTTEPTGGASKWTKVPISGAGFLTGISCPTTAFCAIVDQSGHVITSTAPTSGSWHVSEPLSGNPTLASVSCPSSSFCAATELSGGKVFTSTNPAGSAAEWSATELDGASYLNAISCASASLCVTGGNTDEYVTKEPNGGASKWTKEAIGDFGWVTDESCPSEGLCVAAAFFGELLTSTTPAAGAGTWSATHVTFYENGLNSVSCPSTSFCAAVDGVGDVITGQESVAPLVPVSEAAPTVSGEAIVGKTLIEEHGSWSNGPISGYTYEWQRCAATTTDCAKIPGAEGQSLVLSAEDEGWQIRVLESARNSEGTSQPAASVLTGAVSPASGGPGPGGGGTGEPKGGGGTTSGSTTGSTGTTAGGTTTSGSTSTGGPATATISSSQITSALTQVLRAPAKAAMAKLLKQGTLQLSFGAPEAGTLLVQWYELPPGAKLAKTKAKPVLVASGQTSSTAAGTAIVHLKLTAVGKKLIKHAKSLKLTAKGTFTPTGKAATVTTKTFSLKGGR